MNKHLCFVVLALTVSADQNVHSTAEVATDYDPGAPGEGKRLGPMNGTLDEERMNRPLTLDLLSQLDQPIERTRADTLVKDLLSLTETAASSTTVGAKRKRAQEMVHSFEKLSEKVKYSDMKPDLDRLLAEDDAKRQQLEALLMETDEGQAMAALGGNIHDMIEGLMHRPPGMQELMTAWQVDINKVRELELKLKTFLPLRQVAEDRLSDMALGSVYFEQHKLDGEKTMSLSSVQALVKVLRENEDLCSEIGVDEVEVADLALNMLQSEPSLPEEAVIANMALGREFFRVYNLN
ncbi:hypothetical protein PsorP6_000485 [Peronosclerospora sorghi]|uniref:Uncharacterized protein n=1 Tax=Peronosclerospora sorghi TaxID=230839 RepID=A0ACC0WVF8_9STRA|nr:hypothetical protein PsorP6_000485 [Peronosclerospora sorghi]